MYALEFKSTGLKNYIHELRAQIHEVRKFWD